MAVVSNDGFYRSDDPKLLIFHNARGADLRARCIKDNPPMLGFGKSLSVGDEVIISGTVHNELGFCVCVRAECAFYDYTYFEPIV
jgi:hypothetical protein